MSIKLNATEGKSFDPMPAGSYPARLYSVIHIGTIESEWQGQITTKDKVRLGFEFPTETKVFNEEKGEQPYVLSREFTLSISDKGHLRPFLEGWQGKRMTDEEAINVDLEEWIGKEGLINVVHTEPNHQGSVYANISSISPLPKGLKCPDPVNPPFILNYTDKWDQSKFDSLPEFLKEKMMSSHEYEMMTREKPTTENTTDSINLDDIVF